MSNTPRTIIRIGAAHYDVQMSVGETKAHVDLAKELWGLSPRDRMSRLSGVGDIICKVHGIKQKAYEVKAPRKASVKPRKFASTAERNRFERATRHYEVQTHVAVGNERYEEVMTEGLYSEVSREATL